MQLKDILEVSGCKGIGGIHWDEIKKDVYVCKRTKELVSFEDLDLPKDLLINSEQVSSIETDSESENSESESDDDGMISSKGDPLGDPKLYSSFGVHWKVTSVILLQASQ